MPDKRIDNYDYPLELVRKAVKHLTLRITRHGVVRITLPLKMPEAAALEFLNKRRNWIDKHLARLNQNKTTQEDNYHDGQRIRILDAQCVVKIVAGNSLVIVDGTEITVYSPQPAQAKLLLDDYLAAHARRIIPETYNDIWLRLGELFPGQRPALAIKAATGRWGSYSRRTHRVMLNEKLVRYPKQALELIIVHELCHIIELNHGAGFYRLLAQLLPDWQTRKKLLQNTKTT